jgi:polysaccharide export outer membrane protein
MNLSVLLLLIMALQAAPAVQAPDTPPPSTAAVIQTRDPSSYVIGPQDLLSITVYDEPNLTNRYRVDDAGFVSFPLISRIGAAGLTVAEFGERLRTTLANSFIRNPQVRVEVEQYRSQSVVVTGSVRAPQKLTMTGG